MAIGTFWFGSYGFMVYDDGSLSCGRNWYEDAPTAATELSLPPDVLSARVIACLEAWKNDPSRGLVHG